MVNGSSSVTTVTVQRILRCLKRQCLIQDLRTGKILFPMCLNVRSRVSVFLRTISSFITGLVGYLRYRLWNWLPGLPMI